MPKSSRNKYSALDSSLNDDDRMNEGDNDGDNVEEIELNSLKNNTTEKVHQNPPIISPSTSLPSTSLPSESSSPKPYGLTTRQR